ncbi:myb/SANT-like DNA-binding domain-containing protein 2 [Gopherus flavomarginatus]|uniref:myb/SANT-like DNA-binding domain-containing protein 2 n=1 Tax=Gopherus flavomarginatus TaxID=286002 RepID=UPI0021CC2C6E|nr:myb/SANT-like DNA-binding domain-containing protein 2 [Gopherus flavomarginatus]
MPPCAKRAPAWSTGELLDLISVFGEEAVQSQLCPSRRNYDTYEQISRALLERGHEWDAVQCRVKVKELRSAYCKAREGNCRSGAASTTCRFYKELDVILGGDPTANPRTTMDSSEQGEEGEGEGEGTPRSPRRHAARSFSQSRRKLACRSSWNLLVKKKQRSGFPCP